jgi:hypothetical protein
MNWGWLVWALDISLIPARVALMNSITTLTPQQLRDAADLKERIDALQNQLNQILGGEVSAPSPQAPEVPSAPEAAEEPGTLKETPQRNRKTRFKERPYLKAKWSISRALRKARSEAMKARWAVRRGETPAQEAPAIEGEKPKRKRYISEAGRRAMSLAGKRRWAKARRAARLGM